MIIFIKAIGGRIQNPAPEKEENRMRRLFTLVTALMVALTLMIGSAAADKIIPAKVGMLALLNTSENDAVAYHEATSIAMQELIRHGQVKGVFDFENEPIVFDYGVVFYDELNEMLMGLKVGDISGMEVYGKVAKYLCATNDDLGMLLILDDPAETDCSAIPFYKNMVRNDFSFMLLKGKEALRDELSDAIDAMKEDGTLDRLEDEHINAAIDGREILPVSMPLIEGAETIKVAITGLMPPIDYIAPDGTPAGYNTAVLAEISKRIGKNIELVQVNSLGRATALASGTVDVVFWTRANVNSYLLMDQTEEEKAETKAQITSNAEEEELDSIREIEELWPLELHVRMDMPDDTIITHSYYSDMLVPVALKSFVEDLR